MLGWPWFKICTGVAVFAISSGRDWEIYTHTEVSGVENIGQCGRLSQLRWLWAHLNIVTYLLTYLLTCDYLTFVRYFSKLLCRKTTCRNCPPAWTDKLGVPDISYSRRWPSDAQSDFMVWHRRRRRRCCPHETSRECITKAVPSPAVLLPDTGRVGRSICHCQSRLWCRWSFVPPFPSPSSRAGEWVNSFNQWC